MAAWVLLVVAASWCLVSVAIGLTLCRAITWARGSEPSDEPTPFPAAPEGLPAVSLPAPRTQTVLLDLTAAEVPAVRACGEAPRQTVQP